MTTFYRVDGGRMTFAEYWRMSPEPVSFLIAAGMKLIGLPVRFNFAIPRPDQLFIVDFAELPGSAQQGMKAAIRSAEKAGLRLVFCHRLAVPEPHRLGAAALFLDETNETSLMVMYGQQGEAREVHATCASRFADETLCTTTTMKKTMTPVPGSDIERYPGADPRTLYARHRDHLERLAGRGLIPVPIDSDELPDFVLKCELRYVDFHIGRGVFVPMSEAELEKICGR